VSKGREAFTQRGKEKKSTKATAAALLFISIEAFILSVPQKSGGCAKVTPLGGGKKVQ